MKEYLKPHGLNIFMKLFLLLCSFSMATTVEAANKKQEINLYSNSDISSLDVSKVTDANTFTQLDNVDEGLYQYNAKGKPLPALATKTVISKDKKTYLIDIRKNARWSNGDALTAQDFVYSWRRSVDPNTASEYIYLLSNIKNAAEISAGKKPVDQLGV